MVDWVVRGLRDVGGRVEGEGEGGGDGDGESGGMVRVVVW